MFDLFQKLKKNRPKAHTYNRAVCGPGQKQVEFYIAWAVGGIVNEMNEEHKDVFHLKDVKPVKVS